MSKAEKKEGIERPKYDLKKNAPGNPHRSKTPKYFHIIIPEREKTPEEKEGLKNGRWIPCTWRGCTRGKYKNIEDATKAFEDIIKKLKVEDTYIKVSGRSRAQLVNMLTGEVLRDTTKEKDEMS